MWLGVGSRLVGCGPTCRVTGSRPPTIACEKANFQKDVSAARFVDCGNASKAFYRRWCFGSRVEGAGACFGYERVKSQVRAALHRTP